MSRESSNSGWVEQKLEAARRRVNQIEIEACRIRTDLAQIEAANAAGIVPDVIVPETERPVVSDAAKRPLDWQPAADLIPDGMEILVGAPATDAAMAAEASEQITAEPLPVAESWVSTLVDRSRGMYRRATSPVMASLIAHAAVMILAVSITVVGIERNDAESTRTTLVLGDKQAVETESFDPHQLADLGQTGVQNVTAEFPRPEAVTSVDHDPIPIDFESIVSLEPVGKMGLSDAHDTELGKLPSGAGGSAKDGDGNGKGTASGKQGRISKSPRGSGRTDSTQFFGTAAKGNRFVFVVDNSSSMKGRTAANGLPD